MKIKELEALVNFKDIIYKINLQSLIYKNNLIKERIDILMNLKNSFYLNTINVSQIIETVFNKFPEYIKFLDDKTDIDLELKILRYYLNVSKLELNELIEKSK